MKILKRVGIGLLVLLTVGALFLSYALMPLSIPAKSTYSFDFKKVQALADSIKGPKATSIRVGSGFQMKAPRFLLGVGWSVAQEKMEGWCFQLTFPTNKTLLIDAAMGKALFDKQMSGTFKKAGFSRIQQALKKADSIIFTHEHLDHANGLASAPFLKEIAGKVTLTKEQLGSPQFIEAGFKESHRSLFKPLSYDSIHAIAPGIVLIKAPGHTPGSQMIYIQLQNKKTYLLVGDIAWNMKNITLPAGHARLIHWVLPEDGQALSHQLRFLHQFSIANPGVVVISSHDYIHVESLIKKGLVQRGLQ